MSPRQRAILVVALALVGTIVSGLLLGQHHGESAATGAVHQVCGEGQESGCDVVNRSATSVFAGVPLAAIGMAFYLSLALLLCLGALGSDDSLRIASFLGFVALAVALLVDALLFGIQAFQLHAYCKLCLLTYAINATAFGLLAWARWAALAVAPGLRTTEGRILATGWVLGTLAFAAAAWAGEQALVLREAQRQSEILGPPIVARPPVASPSVGASPTGGAPAEATSSLPSGTANQDQLRAALAEVARLRETLDDPQKLEKYFADKAMKEYEQAPVQAVELKESPFKGPGAAPIKVVEYSDFLCPFCQNLAAAFTQYVPQSANRVAIYFKNHPLDKDCNPTLNRTVHPGACNLALGAVCAQEQGKFWPYHDKVFFGSKLANPQVADVLKLGGEAGLDAAAFQTCMSSPQAKAKLTKEIEEGHRVGVNATPTVLLNGKKLSRINDFIQLVDKEAARLGLPPTPAPVAGSPAAKH